MNKFVLLTVILLCGSVYSFSQATVKGKLLDSSTKKPLGLATVTIFKAADTVLITYRLSNPEGEFKVPGIPFNTNCRVVISFSGFRVFRKEFTCSADNPVFDMGELSLQPDPRSLDEVLVVAERPPVSMRKDTIEFNANAFKTLPNALVEDLLKKLPGVQVDGDGNIMVNGKPVNRILVDGKTFFGDDPKMATRNLPANVIEKVQVMDDKEELLRNGDNNLNNVGKVVNITLKKGVKKGIFGKLYAGAGTDGLFEAGGIANIYRDTLQVSVLAYTNNLNKPGFTFTDLMQTGGLQRNRSNMSGSGTSVWNNTGGSGISINGINFGGAQNYGGISTSNGGGFNLNHAPNNKKSLFLQYFNGNVHVRRRNLSNTSQYNDDTVINNNNLITGDVITHAHNIGLGARLKPDSLTNILINANYTIGLQDEDRFSNISSEQNKLGKLSYGNINQDNLANTYYYRQSLNITRLSRTKKGRRFNLSHSLEINNRFNDYTTESSTTFMQPAPYDSLLNQLRSESILRKDYGGVLGWTEPLTKSTSLRIGASYQHSDLNNPINTFGKDSSNQYQKLNNTLSSRVTRISDRVNTSVAVDVKIKNITISPTARLNWQKTTNRLSTLVTPVLFNRTDLLPGLTIAYKQLYISYDRSVNLPSWNYLVPVSDNTNPYFITRGNTSLEPAIRNNYSINYYYNDSKKNFNAGGYMSYGTVLHDVVQSVVVDDKGVQTTTPVNSNGNRSFSSNYNINKQYKNKQSFTFSWYTGAYYSYNRGRLLFNNESSWQSTFLVNQWMGFGFNWNDKVEWSTGYSIGYNFTDYTSAKFKKLEVVNHDLNTELILRFPKHLVWETQCRYTFNSRISGGIPKDAVFWNAALNITMLKAERGVLRLSAFDLLNQVRSINVNVSRNMIIYNQTNILSQYFMGTFTYNFRPAGEPKKKVGGQRFLLF